MKEKNMTALVSCYSRAYHYKNYKYKIYNDSLAEKLLSEDEYNNISQNMIKGISFFNQNFKGTDEDALRYVVDNQLSPSVLGRGIFTETVLKNEIRLGLRQYLIFASGYDTSAYRVNENLEVFEIDKKEVIKDKKERLKKANIKYDNINYLECDFNDSDFINKIIDSNYDKEKKSFCSLLGISYYLSNDNFERMIRNISSIISKGSVIVFDYPTYNESDKEIINQKLAKSANEEMKSKYSYNNIENIASNSELLIYMNLDADAINREYFYNYNTLNPNNKILAPQGVNYCLMVRK